MAIKGREIAADKRPASNLVFLIDVSGSMQSPDKLPLLKHAMATLVEQLDERDQVAIVVYAGKEGVALPSTRLDTQGRATVLRTLSRLEAGGSTNGGAGIKRAYANRVLRNEDLNNDKVDAGDIGAGHSVTAFYELKPSGAAADTDALKYQTFPPQQVTSNEWLTVKLRYKHPAGDESRRIEFALTGDALALDKVDADYQFATAVALFGMKLRAMEEVRETAWEKVLTLAQPGLTDDPTEDRAEFVELVKKLAGQKRRILPAPAEVRPNPERENRNY
ncbi:MAG: DUF3520 domain-containing protein [Verrucomicrobia bacterium]|nr:DUF3520 domain-containing protein [Verrucomicrobiota bacterium]